MISDLALVAIKHPFVQLAFIMYFVNKIYFITCQVNKELICISSHICVGKEGKTRQYCCKQFKCILAMLLHIHVLLTDSGCQVFPYYVCFLHIHAKHFLIATIETGGSEREGRTKRNKKEMTPSLSMHWYEGGEGQNQLG